MWINKLNNIIPTKAMLKHNSTQLDFNVVKFTDKKAKAIESNTNEKIKKNDTVQKQQQYGSHSIEDSDDHEFNDEEDIFDDERPRQQLKKQEHKNSNEFDMKRARYDVINFGVSGFSTKDKAKAKIALAIKLGAKPQKKEYKNYKELIAERKLAKLRSNEADAFLNVGKNQYGAAKGNFRKSNKKFVKHANKKKSGMLDLYGVFKPQETGNK